MSANIDAAQKDNESHPRIMREKRKPRYGLRFQLLCWELDVLTLVINRHYAQYRNFCEHRITRIDL